MSAVLAAILAAVIPVLAKALVEWLQKLLTKQAAAMTATGDPVADAEALLRAAHAATPRTRPFKRAVLLWMTTHVPAKVATNARLTAAEKKELAALAGPAAGE